MNFLTRLSTIWVVVFRFTLLVWAGIFYCIHLYLLVVQLNAEMAFRVLVIGCLFCWLADRAILYIYKLTAR